MNEVEHVDHVHNNSGSGMGFLLGIILLLVVLFLIFYYGLPYLGRATNPQVNVPGTIDVNVNQPK
jgi:hypothetical protein